MRILGAEDRVSFRRFYRSQLLTLCFAMTQLWQAFSL